MDVRQKDSDASASHFADWLAKDARTLRTKYSERKIQYWMDFWPGELAMSMISSTICWCHSVLQYTPRNFLGISRRKTLQKALFSQLHWFCRRYFGKTSSTVWSSRAFALVLLLQKVSCSRVLLRFGFERPHPRVQRTCRGKTARLGNATEKRPRRTTAW